MELEIYCDESGIEALSDKNAHPYVVIGSIWIPAYYRTEMKRRLKELQYHFQVHGEFKWNKVSPRYLPFYQEIVNYFFSTPRIRYRGIIIDAQQIDHTQFNEGSAEMGFYKFYYQLLRPWLMEGSEYRIFVDYKVNSNKHRIQELNGFLARSNPKTTVLQTQALPSQESLGIQLADVMTGIVFARYNAKTTSPAKTALIVQTEQLLGKPIQATRRYGGKFNIFDIHLQNG